MAEMRAEKVAVRDSVKLWNKRGLFGLSRTGYVPKTPPSAARRCHWTFLLGVPCGDDVGGHGVRKLVGVQQDPALALVLRNGVHAAWNGLLSEHVPRLARRVSSPSASPGRRSVVVLPP